MDLPGMDLPGIAALLLAIGGLIWTGYEKLQAGRVSIGEFANKIAEAADKMVDLSEQVYNRQIEDLQAQLTAVKVELATVKTQLGFYMQCPEKACPVRERANGNTQQSK